MECSCPLQGFYDGKTVFDLRWAFPDSEETDAGSAAGAAAVCYCSPAVLRERIAQFLKLLDDFLLSCVALEASDDERPAARARAGGACSVCASGRRLVHRSAALSTHKLDQI